MEVCFRPCLDYKSHFAAAYLLARSTELRGKTNLLFKARPDKDSYQVSWKGTFVWKSSAATFHHCSYSWTGMEAWGSRDSLPSPNEFFLAPQGVFLTLLMGHLGMLYAYCGRCKPAFTLCSPAVQRNKVPTSNHVRASWEIWRCFAADRGDLVKSHRLTPFLREENQNSWLRYTSKKGS